MATCGGFANVWCVTSAHKIQHDEDRKAIIANKAAALKSKRKNAEPPPDVQAVQVVPEFAIEKKPLSFTVNGKSYSYERPVLVPIDLPYDDRIDLLSGDQPICRTTTDWDLQDFETAASSSATSSNPNRAVKRDGFLLV